MTREHFIKKEDTNYIKGIALILMFFHHFFLLIEILYIFQVFTHNTERKCLQHIQY